MTALVRKESIEELCGHRARALELYAQAYDLLIEAGCAVDRASPTGHFRIPDSRYRGQLFDISVGRDDWAKLMRQAVDRSVWSHLAKLTEMERLMDRQAHDEFRKQLDVDPPEATVDNCFATVQTLIGQADDIFKRGIANVFSSLDRRFRSHDGFKIGSRIILNSCFNEFGSWNFYRRTDETLRDIERTFRVLDGKLHVEYKDSFTYKLDEHRRANRGVSQFEDDYFRIVWFKNGNAHLWFKRADLVEEVNRLLGEYYGAALGDARQRETHEPNRTPAKNDGFFETPAPIVERVLEAAGIWEGRDYSGWSVLEPSAGLGRIAYAVAGLGARVTAVELNAARARSLRDSGRLVHVHQEDFFDLTPAMLGVFDAVLMNPPFDGLRDADHVTHAWKFVKPGGVIVAIMSAGVEFSQTKRAVAFREMVEANGGTFVDLPQGSFKESGTMVNTVMLTMRRRAG